ncbi:hypothetical protein Dimus_019642 [Dionaea muscipula]
MTTAVEFRAQAVAASRRLGGEQTTGRRDLRDRRFFGIDFDGLGLGLSEVSSNPPFFDSDLLIRELIWWILRVISGLDVYVSAGWPQVDRTTLPRWSPEWWIEQWRAGRVV